MNGHGNTTVDGFLGGSLAIEQPRHGYRAATDPVLLAAAVPAQSGDEVLELGCGVGVAALAVALRTGAQVTGVEVQAAYGALARANAARNELPLEVIEGDVASLPRSLREREFSHVFFNPPYYAPGAGTVATTPARERALREETPLAVWVDTATRRLRPGGSLTIIHLAERLPTLLATIDARLGSGILLPLAPRDGRAAGRVILQMRKGGRAPFRLLPPLVLHSGASHKSDGDDSSPEARAILRDGAAISGFL